MGGVIFSFLQSLDFDVSFGDVISRIPYIFAYPTRHAPWFLLALFCIQIEFYFSCVCCNYIKNKRFQKVAEILLPLFIVFIGYYLTKQFHYFCIIYMVCFIGGYQHSQITHCFNKDMPFFKYRNIFIFSLFILFILLVCRFDFHDSSNILKMTIGITASVIIVHTCKTLEALKNGLTNRISYMGQHTLEIYVFQCLGFALIKTPIDVSNIAPFVLFEVLLFFSLLIAEVLILTSRILYSIPYLDLLLFGKLKKTFTN